MAGSTNGPTSASSSQESRGGHEQFSSSLGLILAALGMAIGTGNIWRFPRVLAANGGGAFLIPWAIFLFSWSIPLLMVEFGLGRRSRRGPVGAFATVFGRGYAFLGLFVAMCAILIMFYYSVVTGWCLRYLVRGIGIGFADLTPDRSEAYFAEIATGGSAVLAHGVAIALAAAVVLGGVTRGIERVCRILIPALLVLVVAAAVRAVTLPGASTGVGFLFDVDLARLGDHRTWLEALSQSAWSTGAGWGLLMCYAIYAPPRQRIGVSCAATGIGNNLTSLIAALAIVPAVFALMPLFVPLEPEAVDGFVRGELEKSGPGLTGVTFVWMPVLLERLDLASVELGRWPAVLFFLSLTFAALSSLIALVELATRLLIDFGMSRSRAVLVVLVAGFTCGVPSALSMDLFLNQDWVWGLGLILSGGFMTAGVLRYGAARFRRDCLSVDGRTPGRWLDLVLTVLIPLQFILLIGWWCYQSFQWTAGEGLSLGQRLLAWLDPSNEFSIGTCVLQWGVLLGLGLLLNRWLARAATR